MIVAVNLLALEVVKSWLVANVFGVSSIGGAAMLKNAPLHIFVDFNLFGFIYSLANPYERHELVFLVVVVCSFAGYGYLLLLLEDSFMAKIVFGLFTTVEVFC